MTLDSGAALREILLNDDRVTAVIPEVPDPIGGMYRPIICGAILANDIISDLDITAVLLIKSGSEGLEGGSIVTDTVRMLTFAKTFDLCNTVRDACFTALYEVQNVVAAGKRIQQVNMVTDATVLDPVSLRPFIETSLAVVTDVRNAV